MEDDTMLREVTGNAIEFMGYEVSLARNGEEAVELFRTALEEAHPYDGVILDLVVHGGMGGLETIKALLQMDPTVRVIMSTGFCEDAAARDYERHGFEDVLAKPFLLGDLRRVLAQVTGG
jgi:CheY-like chemotaxis protein